MLWNTTTPGSAVELKGSMVCMIGGDGSRPSKMARTKSTPAIEAITSVGVTPYSTLGAVWSSMAARSCGMMMDIILKALCVRQRFSAYESVDDGVILRCALLRASKDGPRVQASHPSRLAEGGEHLRMTTCVAGAYARFFARIRSANRLNR